MSAVALHRRIDRLVACGKLGQPATADQVTVAELLSGECFKRPRAWTLENLVADADEPEMVGA